jgi:hypothetical protein
MKDQRLLLPAPPPQFAKGVNMKFVIILLFAISPSVIAQSTPQSATNSALCTQESAVQIIHEQIAAAKTLDDPGQRITILLRGADLLWVHQREKSRATFAEAFDLARQNYKVEADVPKRAGRGLLVDAPDWRYVVIRAIAKRDPRWAGTLRDQLLKEQRDNRNESLPTNVVDDLRTSQRLLETAMSLVHEDTNTAVGFAGASLRLPANYFLTAFLFKLAEKDQVAADEFYRRALAYSETPLREFLYLAAYPFGLGTTGDTPVTGSYAVPGKFVPNASLQTLFAQALAARSQRVLVSGVDEQDNYNGLSGIGHIAEVIAIVEPLIGSQAPTLRSQLSQTRAQLLNTLSPELQAELARGEINTHSDAQTFAERLATIDKQQNADKRDELLVTLLLNAGPIEPLNNVSEAASKITDDSVRSQVMDWVYFNRTQKALNDKNFDEAARLSSRVQELDQRAYLYSNLAKALALRPETQVAARELLEQIITTAEKAPNTIVTARAFLAAANLYLKFDADRAVSVLAQAIRSMNNLKSPDFGDPFLIRKIEGRNFARYAAYKTVNFDPESAFREFASINVESAFAQASGVADKALRGQILLSLADVCAARPQTTPKSSRARADVTKN